MNIELEQKLIDEVKKDPSMLEKIQEQTEEICLAAVKQDGLAIQYVKDQSLNVCLAAVKQNGLASYYVKDQSLNMCLAAVKQNGYAIQYVKNKNKTDNVYLQALKQNYTIVSLINIKKRRLALLVLNASLYYENKNKKVLNEIIKKFNKDKEFVDFYTKYKLWKYVDFSNVKRLNEYTMVL